MRLNPAKEDRLVFHLLIDVWNDCIEFSTSAGLSKDKGCITNTEDKAFVIIICREHRQITVYCALNNIFFALKV